MDRQQAAQYLATFDFGLGGLDDTLLDADGELLGCSACGGLGEFIGSSLSSSAVKDAQKVVAAAATPGTETTKVVAGKLARKGVELGKIAHDRAQVAYKATQKRDQLAKKVEKLQPKVDKLLASDNPKSREAGEALKQDQYSAARAAVRLEKVNAMASGMAENAAAQAVIAQQIAGSVIAGKPALTGTLTSMYNKLGQSSASMRKVRKEQIVRSADVLDQDKLRALLARKRALLQKRVDIEVLLTCDPRTQNSGNLRKQQQHLSIQVAAINAEVSKLCKPPRPHSLDELEWAGGLGEAVLAGVEAGLAAKFDPKAAAARRRAAQAAKNREPILDARFNNARNKGWIRLTNRSRLRKSFHPGIRNMPSIHVSGDLDLKIVQAAQGAFKYNPRFPGGKQFLPDVRPLLKGQLGVVEQRLGRKLTRDERDALLWPQTHSPQEIAKAMKAAEHKRRRDYRRMVEKSGSLYRVPVVGDVLNTTKAVAKPIVNVAKAAAETAILPATTAVKLVTKGPAAAIKNISRTMKRSFNTVRKAAGQLFVGLPCQIANSTVGKAAMQIGAAAVGTAIGGPADTVGGAVAANHSQAVTKAACGGLKEIGLDKGDFRTSKLGSALEHTAMGIGKNLADPKALLKDAQSIGTAFIPGGASATGLLNKYGGEQLQKLGVGQIAKNISIPGGATKLLRSAGVPTSAGAILRKAGLPSDTGSLLKAAGVSPNIKGVLKRAGVPTDLPSMVKATQILQKMNIPATPGAIARAMNVEPIPIPGMPGKFRLPRVLPKQLNIKQIQQSAMRRANLVKQAHIKRIAAIGRARALRGTVPQPVAAQRARARRLPPPPPPPRPRALPRVTFARGSVARQLMPYVGRG
ncbi:MAG: hypothetical protein ACE5F6_00325 [Anaerolineae bacterium]